MGWGKDVRAEVWERQSYVCPLCQRFVSFEDMILHHVKVPKHHGGSYDSSNAQGRHVGCEQLAHDLDHHGNPDILYFLEVWNGGRKPRVRTGASSKDDVRSVPSHVRHDDEELSVYPSKKRRKARHRVRRKKSGGCHRRFRRVR